MKKAIPIGVNGYQKLRVEIITQLIKTGAARPRRDTPFIEAHTQGFYKEVSGALSALLHTAYTRKI